MFGCVKSQAEEPVNRMRQSVASGAATTFGADTSNHLVALPAELQTSQAHGFGDLPWHVLRVLMSHVVGHADVDTVRSARLVCRSWREALAVNITTAILRPLTKQALDIDDKCRPVINHELEGLRAPTRQEYRSITEDVLESGYTVHVADADASNPGNGVSLKEAQDAEAEADQHWENLKKSSLFPGACFCRGPARANSLGHYPFEDSLLGDSDLDDVESASAKVSDVNEQGLHIPDGFEEMLGACSQPEQLSRHRRTHSAATAASMHLCSTAPGAPPGPSAEASAGMTHRASWQRSADLSAALAQEDSPHSPNGRRRRPRARRPWLPTLSRRHADSPQRSVTAPGSADAAQPQRAVGTVVLASPELDEYALSLRQQYGYAADGADAALPAVVLRVGDSAPGATAGSTGGLVADEMPRLLPTSGPIGGGSPPAAGVSPPSTGASPPSHGSRLAIMKFWGRSRASAPVDDAADDLDAETASVELTEQEQQVVQALAHTRSMEMPKLEVHPGASISAGGAADSAAAGIPAGEIAALLPPQETTDECRRYPTPQSTLLRRPSDAPLTIRVRRNLIEPQHAPQRAVLVSLAPLLGFTALRTLALRQAVYGADAEALAALTGLTHLSLRLHRRDRLGLGNKLTFLPPPGSHDGLWAAIVALPALRRLDLSHSRTVTPGHLAMLTALTALGALDLTEVHLPVAALAPLQTLTTLTQLRIPNVKIVSERFMQLLGEQRNVPRLAELIAALPQLRHLDLFWQGSGDNQSIMKDPKHMRTLAAATQLRRLDIAKVAQVTDRSLDLLSPLTAITALKLGCNAWDLYRLTGRAFVMLRNWRGLRVLHVEACRNLEKDAFVAVAASCPALECLHLDTACRVTPAAFNLATLMPVLSVLELVDLGLVPDALVCSVCMQLPALRPGMAAHIIALKRCAGHNLGKFGEKIPGGFLGKLIS